MEWDEFYHTMIYMYMFTFRTCNYLNVLRNLLFLDIVCEDRQMVP